MRILIVNPNMTQKMTDLMVEEGKQVCRSDTEIIGISAEFGVSYIATRSEMTIAGYALLDCLARHHHGFDAVIIGAFCHTFVAPAKELTPLPVIGLAEAGMRAAQLFGRRITIIGIGGPERGANEEIISDLHMEHDIASIRILPLSGTELAADHEHAEKEVIRLGEAAVAEDYADTLVLGGSAFSGMAGRIAPHLPVPVISPLAFAVAMAEMAVVSGCRKPTAGTYSAPGNKPTKGLSRELTDFFK